MQSLQARIDSFHKTKRVKRNPAKPSSTTASLKWPHPPEFKPNADTLAEAGFYFSPSWSDRDSVTCFLCGKELSDWDEDDDPFQIHYSKCRVSCPWAVVRCGLFEDINHKGRFVFEDKTRLPSSKAMEKARLETFGEDWWPHDREEGHSATSVKMAQAGFVYTPQAAGDDTVTCLYCNISLSGWEAEDDPDHEHRTRDSKAGSACPFVALSSKPSRPKHAVDKVEPSEDELADARITDPPPSRPKRGKARSAASAASSKSRRKTRATRGKSTKSSAPPPERSRSPSETEVHKSSAPPPQRSRSPSESDAREQVPAVVPDATMNVDAPPAAAAPELHSVETGSPPAPSPPNEPSTLPNIASSHPAPALSSSPAGQPIITTSHPLTDHEKKMSLEQWIRQEISIGYETLLTDGQRQIELFKTKAAELRKCIDEL